MSIWCGGGPNSAEERLRAWEFIHLQIGRDDRMEHYLNWRHMSTTPCIIGWFFFLCLPPLRSTQYSTKVNSIVGCASVWSGTYYTTSIQAT